MHEDDKAWVKKQIMKLDTTKMRQEVLIRYKEAFYSAYDAEPLPHKKDGAARFAANNRLRIFIEKVTGNKS